MLEKEELLDPSDEALTASIKLKVDRAVSIIKDLEAGRITGKPRELPIDVFAGDVIYDLSIGGTLTIFCDCLSWDYVDSVVFPDGISLVYNEIAICDHEGRYRFPEIAEHSPEEDLCVRIYQFPSES